jgi:hypothetical protein
MDRTSFRFADLDAVEVAAIIATGKGELGTNHKLAHRVALLGIEDQVVFAMSERLRLTLTNP